MLAALPAGDRDQAVRRLDDVHLRGLLTLLADDARVTTFADRELSRLRDEPELLRTLRALLEHPGSKSAAAAALNISRPVLYDRIARLERSSVSPSTTPRPAPPSTSRSSPTTYAAP